MSRSNFQTTRPNNEAGFTLFELIIAMLLLAMVSVMIYSILNVGITFSAKGEDKILAIERRHGLLNLMQRQINSALYDQKEKKLLISADDDLFHIVTRSPFIYRSAGVVLALYRYNQGDETIYYQEKRDYYNIDYDEEYIPDFDDMIPLLKTEGSFSISYNGDTSPEVILEYGSEEYIFIPKCLNEEFLNTLEL